MDARAIVLVVAVNKEADAVSAAFARPPGARTPWRAERLDEGFDLLLAGVGKANAAGAVARAIDPARHRGAISVGVCGSLPGGPGLGAVVAATSCVYADEGLTTPGGFVTMSEMGFPIEPFGDAVPVDPGWLGRLSSVTDVTAPIATVSTCAGTDAWAREVAARTGAAVEAMEGAAVGHALARVDPALSFGELRVVSNTCGDRGAQRWDLGGALERLAEVLGRVRGLGL